MILAIICPLVLFGWAFDVRFLKSSVPNLTAMNPTTALLFLCCGASMYCLNQPHRQIRAAGALFAGIVLSVAAIRLTTYALSLNFGIDTLLFRDKLEKENLPNRIAPNTALAFFFAGLGLLLTASSKYRPIIHFLSLAVFLIGLGTAIGYSYSAIMLTQVNGSIPMSLPTGLMFLITGFGLAMATGREGLMRTYTAPTHSAGVARMLTLCTILVPAALGLFCISAERRGFVDSINGQAALTTLTVSVLIGVVWVIANQLSRVEKERDQAMLLSESSRAEVEDLYNNAPCGYHSLDENGVFTRINDTELRWLGYTRDEVIGKLRFLDILAPGSHRTFESSFPQFIQQGRVTDLEFEMVRKSGMPFWVSLNAVAVRDEEGNYLFSRSTMFDITDRKRNVSELNEARSFAEQTSEAKSEFLSRMSHELRTPLNSILGFTQLLDLKSQDPSVRECSSAILRSGRHLLDLINEVLDLSRIETGKLAVSIEPVTITGVMKQAFDMVAPLAEKAQVTLRISRDICDDTHVLADRQRLMQVCINLVSNAVKYSRPGGLVEVVCRQSDANIRSIEVRDNGIGISPANWEKIFSPFERGEATDQEGTGLGLSLSRRLIEVMNGRLYLESSSTEGSVFVIELPAAQGPVERVQAEPKMMSSGPKVKGAKRVLSIEDNLSNISLMEHVFAAWGSLELVSVMQGWRGIEVATETVPDLILLDLHLPDISGTEVMQRLQADPKTAHIPIVIVSADATDRQIRRLLSQGAADYLTKPLDLSALSRTIERCLGTSPKTDSRAQDEP